jgi:hypothetical protein
MTKERGYGGGGEEERKAAKKGCLRKKTKIENYFFLPFSLDERIKH